MMTLIKPGRPLAQARITSESPSSILLCLIGGLCWLAAIDLSSRNPRQSELLGKVADGLISRHCRLCNS